MRRIVAVGMVAAALAAGTAGAAGAQAPWRVGVLLNQGGPERTPRPGIGLVVGRHLLGDGPLRLEVEAGGIFGRSDGREYAPTFAMSRPPFAMSEPVLQSVVTAQAGMVFSPSLGGAGSRLFVRAHAGGWWSRWTEGSMLYDVQPLNGPGAARGGLWQLGLGAPLPFTDQSTTVEVRVQSFTGPRDRFGGRAWSPQPTVGLVVARALGGGSAR
jgi:hypothetical protein